MTKSAAMRRFRNDLLAHTFVLTRAQQSVVDLEIAVNPIAKADPVLGAAVAAAHGWPISNRKPQCGLAAAIGRQSKG